MQTQITLIDECDSSIDDSNCEYYTPLSIIELLGEFALDPCGARLRENHMTAANVYKGTCGLIMDWYRRIWLNPPYGLQIGEWMQKMLLTETAQH